MFIVLEIQTFSPTNVAVLTPITKTTREEAESTFHSILSYAAVSDLPMHAAVLMTNEGVVLDRKAYIHKEPEAPPVIEEEDET